MILRIALILLVATAARADDFHDVAQAAARCAGFNDAGQIEEDARGTGDQMQRAIAGDYMRAALILWPEGTNLLTQTREAAKAEFLAAGPQALQSAAQPCQNLGLRLNELTGVGFH